MKRLLSVLLISLCLAMPAKAGEGSPETLTGDTRQVRGPESPLWLAAIGRSVSVLRAHDDGSKKAEGCTWSLVTDSFDKDGSVIVGAGHCVDHWRTADDHYQIGDHELFWKTNDGRTIKRKIAKIIKTEMIPGDYAIAVIDNPISKDDVQPLINAPYDYTDLMDPEMFDPKPFATMAGYSADTGIGENGNVLTYDVCERVNGGAPGSKRANCYTYGGASGGPLVVTVNISENFPGSVEGESSLYYLEDDLPGITFGTYHFFVGTIVGSRGGDDNSVTMFTETTYYAQVLDKTLSAH